MRILGLLAGAGVVAAVALSTAVGGAAALPVGGWSAPATTNLGDVAFVSCASAAFCGAVDQSGDAVIFRNGVGGLDGGVNNELDGVSCPSSSFCLAIDKPDEQFVFYRHGRWVGPRNILLQAGGFNAVACTSASFCIVGDDQGSLFEYNGRTVKRVARFGSGDPFSPSGWNFVSISCPSRRFCVALDVFGRAAVFSNGRWRAISLIFPHNFDSVSCTSASFCLAASRDGRVSRYNGRSWGTFTPIGVHAPDLSCASSKFCMAVNDVGQAVRYNGRRWGQPVKIDSAFDNALAVSCPTSAFCLAVDDSAHAFTYTAH